MRSFPAAEVATRLRESVYPAVDGYWRADAAVTAYLNRYLPGMEESQDACGPAALNALFGPEASSHLAAGSSSSWMNRRMMELSLTSLGVDFEKSHDRLPSLGIALIQWVYQPEKRSFRGSFLADTHWIAVIDDFFFDVNWPQWLPSTHWESLVGRRLIELRGAAAWRVVTGYSISPKSRGRQEPGIVRPSVGCQTVFSKEEFAINVDVRLK